MVLDAVADGAAPLLAPPPGRLPVSEVATLPAHAVFERLTPSRQTHALTLLGWLASARQRESVGAIVGELCERFIQAGLPLDRYSSSTTMVTADHDAVGRVWWRDQGVREVLYVGPGGQDPRYLASPFKVASETGQWVDLWLPATPNEQFGIVPELRAAGIVEYLCAPMRLTNGAEGWISFATRAPEGFAEQDLLVMAFCLPTLLMRIDARVGWMTLDKLLRTYVGDEPHQAILAGRAKRGQVSAITAAVLVADLRDSTGHVADLGALAAVGLLNEMFDCLVPDIEAQRGDVLKYMGDGLLAIFREEYMGPPAADRALLAAEAALAAVAAFNAAHPDRRPLKVGIALHYGEVAYGNIGSGSRLDFTVIGRDVALASRIAAMNGPLDRALLLSAAFAERIARDSDPVGSFPARGFDEPLAVLAPRGEAA